ncbi:alpha-amylase domain-containing protein [Paraflavisolibacter sp. H34]|uniref:alpha-amylase domain-containing protein n=1 Tax=Huijunlia imazamoxiresistens TaxID=3127457 RepID=UPI0030176C93
MKRKHALFTCCFLALSSLLLFSCKKQKDAGTAPPPAAEAATPSGDVMLQTFYWDVTPGGVWWDTLQARLDPWKSAGITGLWLPVISKGQSGQYSMGYDPYDYFDFGQYNQQGTTETRFGSYAELKTLLTSAKAKGFTLFADIVLNHNSGGDLEANPYTGTTTYTKFVPKSGKFNRGAADFHPNALHARDEDVFGGFADLCHDAANVKDWLWKRQDGVAKFYRDSLGFSGWRFDFVKGFAPSVIKDWLTEVGGKSIIEYWDGDVKLVNNYATAAGSGAFDFPLMYAMKNAFDGGNMAALETGGLIRVDASKAYTFVANHDVDEISAASKLMAYAYILTSEGTPFIFYKDYEWLLDKAKMHALIQVRKTLAAGSTTTLFASPSLYVFRRNGTPGLVAYFNNGATGTQRTVQTTWANKVLRDYTGANPDVTTDAGGQATIYCPAKSFAIYAPR